MTNTHHEYWKRRKQRQKMNKFGVTIDITHLHRSIQICGSSIPVSSESIWAIFWEQQQPVFKYVDGLSNIILSLFYRECFLSIGIFEEKKNNNCWTRNGKRPRKVFSFNVNDLLCQKWCIEKCTHSIIAVYLHRLFFATHSSLPEMLTAM